MSKVNVKLTLRPVLGSEDRNVKKYYGAVESKGCITMEQLAEEITAMCTVTLPDVKGVLAAFQAECIDILKNGDGVSFAELGTMYVHCSSETRPAADNLSLDNVKKIYPYFTTSRRLNKKVSVEKLAFNIK